MKKKIKKRVFYGWVSSLEVKEWKYPNDVMTILKNYRDMKEECDSWGWKSKPVRVKVTILNT